MNNTKPNRTVLVVLASLVLFQSFAFAAVPQVVTDYVDVLIDIAKGRGGIIAIFLVLVFSGYMAWKNNNVVPFFWGLAASVLIGGAPTIAERFVEFGNTSF